MSAPDTARLAVEALAAVLAQHSKRKDVYPERRTAAQQGADALLALLARAERAEAAARALREALEPIAEWAERQAKHEEMEAARPNQFLTLRDAYAADAANHRKMAAAARAALGAAPAAGEETR